MNRWPLVGSPSLALERLDWLIAIFSCCCCCSRPWMNELRTLPHTHSHTFVLLFHNHKHIIILSRKYYCCCCCCSTMTIRFRFIINCCYIRISSSLLFLFSRCCACGFCCLRKQSSFDFYSLYVCVCVMLNKLELEERWLRSSVNVS